MLCLQQPSRLSPSPPWYLRGRCWKSQQFLHTPTMIRKPRHLSRSTTTPLSERAVSAHQVVGGPYQPHSRFKRKALVRSCPAPTRQRSQPSPEGGVEAFDIGGVDQCPHRTLGPYHPADHLRLGA